MSLAAALRGVLLGCLLGGSAAAQQGDPGVPASKLHFDPFKRPAPAVVPVRAAPAPAPAPEWTPRLRGVMVAGRESMANVDGVLVAIDEQVDGRRLVEVTERRAVFEMDGVLHELVVE